MYYIKNINIGMDALKTYFNEIIKRLLKVKT